MSEREIRLCMIGAGNHSSRNIYPNFYKLKQARVVANCDLDITRAEAAAAKHGIATSYTDYTEMLAKEQPDGVLVCVGESGHATLGVDLLARGCNVYVEKPQSPDLAGSRALYEAARTAGRICMVAFKKRFGGAYRKARDIIASDEFGETSYLGVYRGRGGRREDRSGYVWSWGCHATDLVPFLFGPVRDVQALKCDQDWSALSVNLKFQSGAAGQLAFATPGGSWEEVLAIGSGGRAVKVSNSIFLTHFDGNEVVDTYTPSFTTGYVDGASEMGFLGELQEFADAIREQRQPEANIARASHSAALHAAFMKAIDVGGTVAVEQFEELPTPRGRET